MTNDLKGDLSPQMLARLEKFKAKVVTDKKIDVLRKPSPGNYIARRKDADDYSDLENKEMKGQ
jgi:hypothetical protein